MGRGIRIGTVLGAPLSVSPWWFLVAGFLTLLVAPVYEDWLPDLGSSGQYALAAGFVVLLYGSAFLHELGHAFSARAFGLRVHSIELTALGGLTRMDNPLTPGRAAVTSAAGPLVNVVLGAIGLFALNVTADGTLAHLLAAQLTWTNALVAAFNLIPGLPLDGGAILRAAVWRLTGRAGTGTVVAAWGGRLVAIAAGLWWLSGLLGGGDPLDGVFILLIAIWMWSVASATLTGERVRAAVPGLVARDLARPVVTVPADLPVSLVLARLAETGARGAVVSDSAGTVVGVVNEAAVAAVPQERRPWVTASTVSRRLEPGLEIDPGLTGEQLLLSLAAHPATEYLVRDADGTVVGVLTAGDVEAALRR